MGNNVVGLIGSRNGSFGEKANTLFTSLECATRLNLPAFRTSAPRPSFMPQSGCPFVEKCFLSFMPQSGYRVVELIVKSQGKSRGQSSPENILYLVNSAIYDQIVGLGSRSAA